MTGRIFAIPAALMLAAALGGCGGNDDGDREPASAPQRTPSRVATTPSGATAAASVTPTPAPVRTATPAATATPSPTATPAVLTFDRADGGSGSKTADSSGPLGVVYARASFQQNAAANRLQATALVNIGVNEKPRGTAYIFNPFRVPGSGTIPVSVQISSDVAWRGVLAGNGAAGTRAAVSITMSVLEGSRTIATEVVHTEELRESALTIGGFDDVGSTPVDMDVSLVPGVYELRLTLTCDAASGLIGVVTHCVFGPSDTYDDGSVTWGPRTILFGQ